MKNKKALRFGREPKLLLILVFFSFVAVQGFGQKNKEYILENTNVEALRLMAIDFAAQYERTLQIARENGWPTSNLSHIDEQGLPVYVAPTNSDASVMTQTTGLRNNLGVQGDGMKIGMWEANDPQESTNYAARSTHQDLTGRVTILDGNSIPSSHATHVAGTLIGNGAGNANAKGMAPLATMDSYSAAGDLAKMTAAAANGLLISNHSYGANGGWKKESSHGCFLATPYKKWTWYGESAQFVAGGYEIDFGRYALANGLDNMCYNAPCYLPVYASGNADGQDPDEGITCEDEVRNGEGGAYVDYNPAIHPGGNSAQRSTISLFGNAKNILTVGNLHDNQQINESSSRGMTDDGRIKPDICGNGTSVFSTESSSDNAYGEKTGTSMASPNVAGSLLLLQELYEQLNGNVMLSASLKGLALHTATDLGNPGPDFTYGWGLLNAHYAGLVINSDANIGNDAILEKPAPNGLADTFYSDGTYPIRVTLCYTDKPGTETPGHDDSAPKLVNDLDVTLVHVGGSSYAPYVMNFSNPDAVASTGDNDRDNVEQIYVASPPVGNYEVHVNVEGALTGAQPYSLIVSGRSCFNSTTIDHSGTIPPNLYTAGQINSSGTVVSGTGVTYHASSKALLLPGFSAQSGSSFIAKAIGCL